MAQVGVDERHLRHGAVVDGVLVVARAYGPVPFNISEGSLNEVALAV